MVAGIRPPLLFVVTVPIRITSWATLQFAMELLCVVPADPGFCPGSAPLLAAGTFCFSSCRYGASWLSHLGLVDPPWHRDRSRSEEHRLRSGQMTVN